MGRCRRAVGNGYGARVVRARVVDITGDPVRDLYQRIVGGSLKIVAIRGAL